MAAAENKAVVSRIFDEVWNQGNVDRIADLFAPDFQRHGLPPDAPQGADAERAHRLAFRAVFPDLKIQAEEMIAEGDKVAVRYTWRGVYQSGWPDVPAAAGRRVTMSGVAIHRIVDGRVTDLWVVADELGLMRQLDALPGAL